MLLNVQSKVQGVRICALGIDGPDGRCAGGVIYILKCFLKGSCEYIVHAASSGFFGLLISLSIAFGSFHYVCFSLSEFVCMVGSTGLGESD